MSFHTRKRAHALVMVGVAVVVGGVWVGAAPGAGGDGEERITSPVQRPARGRRPAEVDRSKAAGPALFPNEFRTIDGVGNNVANPEWGASAIQLLRLAPVGYGDGGGAPAGADRPSARLVSNVVCAQVGDMPNHKRASDYLWQWGQFLDHDIDETPVASPREAFDIPVPAGDVYFDPDGDGDKVINLDRSAFDETDPIRQQLNNITSFIDASNVYGSDAARATALRTNDGTGRMRTSAGDLLPYNTEGFDNAPTGADPTFFLGGDIRANEQIGLTAMHTLFVREHNFHADRIRAEHPEFTGEQVYQHARAIVAAEMQAITYREFLPVLLGKDGLPPYQGYDTTINASVANEFATAAYRVGHTMLSSTVLRLGADNATAPEGNIPLLSAFFNPGEIEDHGIDSILRGLAGKPAQIIDTKIVDDVRNFLFGPPGSGGFDLVSLNIQRGRDHGLASYNQLRTTFGLPAAVSFADITPDPEVQGALASAYGDPGKVDAWVGLLAEPHRPGSLVGETLQRVLRDQFVRLRDGDRFWYRSYLPAAMVDQVERDTLAVIIRRNTGIGDELDDDVFHAPAPDPLCVGDLDGDGVVTVFDFGIFVETFGTNDPACDFDKSGVVDVFDFAIFAQQFETVCEE